MQKNEKRYDVNLIREKAENLLISHNLSRDAAFVVIDSMLEADLCGVSTHGIRMLPSYINKLSAGQFSLEEAQTEKKTAAFSKLDCKNSIGAVSASRAVELAVEGAREAGIHCVFAKNCNTFGPAFYFAEKIASQGMVGFVCCNSPAAMPAHNGLQVMLGTNPLAFACPSLSEGTISLDMATSIVAKSRFEIARVNGTSIPEGWALDSDGNPTTDPLEAIKGFILPMAGFKGYGIAMMIDIISGFLSGAAYLNNVGKFYSQTNEGMNVGQLFVAIDPSQVYDGCFLSDMDNYINTLRSSKVKEGETITLPGDDKVACKKFALENGIVLSDETAEKLFSLFQ